MKTEKWMRGIFSDGSSMFLQPNQPTIGKVVVVKIRVFSDSPVSQIYISYMKNGEQIIKDMTKEKREDLFTYYEYTLEMTEKILSYHFVLATDETVYFYTQKGIDETPPLENYNFKVIGDFECPTWLKKSIFYQIFPDRFFNGDATNDVRDKEYEFSDFRAHKREWEEEPGEYEESGALDFFGGDLGGIQQKISYLKNLGINALYINPIFKACTNHKYDCLNYLEVDQHLGGNLALEELSKALHKEDMFLILDISINHTSNQHAWTKEHPEFYHQKIDGSLECWNGVTDLITLNFEEQKLRNVIYKDEDSVLIRWLKEPYNIDGWRFDVGQSVGKMNCKIHDQEIWRQIRERIKGADKEKFIMVEHWDDCIRYLQGDMWDASMNYYGFTRNIRVYLGEDDPFLHYKLGKSLKKNSPREFIKRFQNQYAQIPYQISTMLFNFINSHDVSRLHTSPYITARGERAAIIMLFTFIGIPSIYYGDEVRIGGRYGSDAGTRFPMRWNEKYWDKEINNLYKKLIQYRNSEVILQTGSFKFIEVREDVLCYVRFNKQKAILVLNAQSGSVVTLNISLDEVGNYEKLKVIESIGGDGIILENNNISMRLESEGTVLIELE